jgi:hypothetical protein
MGNSNGKGGSDVSEQTVLSEEERNCLYGLFESICHVHSECRKEDLTVSAKL